MPGRDHSDVGSASDYDNDDGRGDIAAILETPGYLLKQMHCSNLHRYPFS